MPECLVLDVVIEELNSDFRAAFLLLCGHVSHDGMSQTLRFDDRPRSKKRTFTQPLMNR